MITTIELINISISHSYLFCFVFGVESYRAVAGSLVRVFGELASRGSWTMAERD